MSTRPVVVVTRPVEQAVSLAQQLEQWGCDVLLLPALIISPVPWSEHTRTCLQQLHQFDFVHFSSPNAIRYALEPLAKKPIDWALFTHIGLMGHGSQECMRHYAPESEPLWITSPAHESWDSESLIEAMACQAWAKSMRRALLIKGQGGRELLAHWLRSLSVEVEYAEVYRRECVLPNPDIETKLQFLSRTSRCIWLLSSSEATFALTRIISSMPNPSLQQKLWQSVALVTHERVALAAHQGGFQRVILCQPGEQALKAALESLYD
jgi:uroporphyrinogen-III synthase